MLIAPKLEAEGMGSSFEVAVSAEITLVIDRSVQVVRPVRVGHAAILLRSISLPGKVMVADTGHQLIAPNDDSRGPTDIPLAPVMVRRIQDGIGRDLRLIDRRHRLRLPRQPALHPIELRR